MARKSMAGKPWTVEEDDILYKAYYNLTTKRTKSFYEDFAKEFGRSPRAVADRLTIIKKRRDSVIKHMFDDATYLEDDDTVVIINKCSLNILWNKFKRWLNSFR